MRKRLEEELEDDVQQQVMPAMMLDKQGAVHDVEAQQEEIERARTRQRHRKS